MEGYRRVDEQEFNLKEWHLRARISRENTLSRRYSASYIRSFREESRSFRSNFTISSTASSPGHLLKDEIDPTTYSFTTALKALQARSGYVWEWFSPENHQGLALNSKWDEAERYICNPLSGEVPMECLSAKTLSGRSFRSYMAGRVTMSAPLVFSAHPKKTTQHHNHPNNNVISHSNQLNQKVNQHNYDKNHAVTAASVTAAVIKQKLLKPQMPPQEEEEEEEEKEKERKRTRDVGTQSTPPAEAEERSSSSPSPTSTPSIKERVRQRGDEENEDGETQNSSSTTNFDGETQNSGSTTNFNDKLNECTMQVQVKVTSEEEETKKQTKEAGKNKKKKKKKTGQFCICRQSSGCLLLSSSSWSNLWLKKRHKVKNNLNLIDI